MSANITAGDLTVKAESVYAPLVPSAKVESPLLDQYGGYTGKTMVATSASNRSVSCRFVHITGTQSRTYLCSGVFCREPLPYRWMAAPLKITVQAI
ncbi:hypothetical protein ACTL6P_12940 [Endozoicomonas acroporae]|uniref:hypothetical protein n=1 Tax=Endozoicomonas acroporae TaxID=1701104 RepID=UPI000C77988A|nr:hypothetical protein [Endozoicomonas acroporae]